MYPEVRPRDLAAVGGQVLQSHPEGDLSPGDRHRFRPLGEK
jgi:hypothetical protein